MPKARKTRNKKRATVANRPPRSASGRQRSAVSDTENSKLILGATRTDNLPQESTASTSHSSQAPPESEAPPEPKPKPVAPILSPTRTESPPAQEADQEAVQEDDEYVDPQYIMLTIDERIEYIGHLCNHIGVLLSEME